MKLFISYARVDRPTCVQIVDMLRDAHEVWYDFRLLAGQNWWQEIVRRIMDCDGFIFLISPESLESYYCINELDFARGANKPIFPVIINPEAKLPETLAHLHYADVSKGLTYKAVKDLLSAIHRTELNNIRSRVTPDDTQKDDSEKTQVSLPKDVPEAPPDAIPSDPGALMAEINKAMANQDYARAVQLIKQARDWGVTNPVINLSELLKKAESRLKRQTYEREAAYLYETFAPLAKNPVTRQEGCKSFAKFRQLFPDYDPEGLANICAVSLMPDIEWCDVTEGEVTLEYDSKKVIYHVDSFRISKHPITNAQFQAFVNDPNGYCNPCWWDFSPQAKAWRKEHPKPAKSKFHWGDHPRDSVCWYEAMAYCNWLSAMTGKKIYLPNEQQWQRAAQGDDDRRYPWGNRFDKTLCNTRESNRMTTCAVGHYDERSASPFGVHGMAGNVWQWCRNSEYHKGRPRPEPTSPDEHLPRAVRGGSFMSVAGRVHSSFHYYLNPLYRYATIGFRIAMEAE